MIPSKKEIIRIPNSWDQKSTSGSGEGWRWSDPNNPSGNYVRIDRGNPYSSDPIQQVDHVHVRYNGTAIKADGSSVPPGMKASKVPETHILLDDWLNWTNWFSP